MITCEQMEQLFRQTFFADYRTQLVAGCDTPLYLPATPLEPAKIIYANGFVSSTLHEIAHWCIAGPKRRTQQDYGYWYVPDRGKTHQAQFQDAEVRPQALEWQFSCAIGLDFFPSLDNLNSQTEDIMAFWERLRRQSLELRTSGLPTRAAKFLAALLQYSGRPQEFADYWLRMASQDWREHVALWSHGGDNIRSFFLAADGGRDNGRGAVNTDP